MWNNGDDTTGREAIELEDLGDPDPSTLPWHVLPNELWTSIGEEDSDLRWNMRQVSPNFESLFTLPDITPPPIQSGRSIEVTMSCPSPITSLVEYSPDILVSGHEDGKIRVWNKNDSTCLNTLQNHNFPVKHLTVFRNDCLISGAKDGIRVWDQGGECVKTLSHPDACDIHALTASRKSSWFACVSSCGNDAFIFAGDCYGPSSTSLNLFLSRRLSHSENPITNIGDDRIAFLDQNNDIIVFNLKTINTDGQPLKLKKPWNSEPEKITYLVPLGTCYLACGTESGINGAYCDNARGNIYIWSWRTGDLIREIKHYNTGRMQPIQSMTAFDHGELVTTHYDRLCFWDCKTGKLRDFRESNIPNFTVKLSNFRFASAINNGNNSYICIENLRVQQPKSKPQKCVIQ